MKNVAIFIPTIKSGGAEKQATLLAAILGDYCHMHFICFDCTLMSQANRERLEVANINIYLLHGNIFRKVILLYHILQKQQIEVIFNYLTFCNVMGACVGRLAKVKTIYNGIRNSRMPLMKLTAEWFVHNFVSSATIYNCYSGAKYFEKNGFCKTKNIVIPNYFPDIIDVYVREEKDIKNIITVGRFVPQKDYQTAIHAIAYLSEYCDSFCFHIVGYGELELQIRNWISFYKVEDKVILHINPTDIPSLLYHADIYLSTSLFEGTSNSIMEAMNYSLPIVATNVGDNDRLVIDGQNGSLHPVGSVSSLSKSLLQLLKDKKMRNTYGCRSNEILRSKYSEEEFTNRYLNLL